MCLGVWELHLSIRNDFFSYNYNHCELIWNWFLCRTSASSTVEELRKQITAMHEKEQQLQQRNNELQHVLLDVQNKLDNMKDQASVAASLVSLT